MGLEAASYFPMIDEAATAGLTLGYASQGDFKNVGINLFALGLSVFVGDKGKVAVKATEEVYKKLLASKSDNTFYTVSKVTETKEGTNVDATVKHDGNVEKPIILPENEKYVDILSPEAKQHILYGDKPGSDRHLYPGKTVFSKSWSAGKAVHEIRDITTSPNIQWYAQTGGIYTAKRKSAN